MKIAVFSSKPYDSQFLDAANTRYGYELVYIESHLNEITASLTKGFDAVCVFVNDDLGSETLEVLHSAGVRWVALRCAGFNNVDLEGAERLGIGVVRVPEYSPYAVAEHAVALMLSLNRKIHRAHNRIREGNFSLNGLLGFDLHGKTVGVIGTGKIGQVFAQIMKGFGCPTLAFDPYPNDRCKELGVKYVGLDELLGESDIISLHCPLNKDTKHVVNASAISKMRDGVMLVNTSRGGLIDSLALINGLKSGRIGSVGLDVYEEEEDLFFEDLSNTVIQDDVFARLMTFPNVLISSHQAFFTSNAMEKIANVTFANLEQLAKGMDCPNKVTIQR
ncbi:2-hydroxyacid dehydrogenase [Puniceicoccaceae bacterium K14]|nr:2-hydroxyacid dehydrogenase [Puniceicoccaceae bacterium K14]